MKKIEFFKHNVGEEEKKAVSKCLDSIFLTTGKKTQQFEEDLAKYIGLEYALGTMSCTHALELALKSLGIGSGDEVITTPLTFAATTLAVLHIGATPVWVDVDLSTGNIDPKNIRKAITKKTKAILPVHLYGQMCDMLGINKISFEYSLVVVEDAAHALESSINGLNVGELSEAACFSFYPTKSITCGEGGAIATNSLYLYEKMKINRTHGMSLGAADRYTNKFKHWDLVDIGMKCNMSDIQASMLIPQLEKADYHKGIRREIYIRYEEAFKKNSNIKLLKVNDYNGHAYHLFTIQVDPNKRDDILYKLQEANIGVAVNYRSLNYLSAFSFMNKPKGSFPNAELIGDSTISLPLYSKLTDKEQTYIIDVVNKIL
jgi:dTDP-4-amino-4,6-dideoxygalactose transaminase